ncbi:hypothetical protein Gotri_025859, partial [Gossypium trilobum]|nr:hypothetical protein [Gossypium trilobum]
TIPLDIESLNALQYLDLSDNKLSGRIPLQIGGLSLYQLDLSHNILQGVKPSQFESLTLLNILILSRNNLTGMIPEFLVYVRNLNLSFNSLKVPIPDGLLHFAPETFTGNKDLCGSIQGFLPCPSSPSIAFEDIIKVTEDFDIKYCIGRGGYGSVYRVAKVVALK